MVFGLDGTSVGDGLAGLQRRAKALFRQGRLPYCAYDPRYGDLDLDGLPAAESDLERAAEVYATIETVARDNGLPALASESFVGRKDVQHRDHVDENRRLMRARSTATNLVARYGESPWRVLGTAGIVIGLCGLLYWGLGLIEPVNGGGTASFLESIYFSALTFTTLGYGDFRPAGTVGQYLAVSETAIGVTLLAILVFVFGRRATR
jgi:voltage-gated potassium channel Kch